MNGKRRIESFVCVCWPCENKIKNKTEMVTIENDREIESEGSEGQKNKNKVVIACRLKRNLQRYCFDTSS